MPAHEKILGFTNQWYADGITHRILQPLPSGKKIYIFAVEYFIASKIEAEPTSIY